MMSWNYRIIRKIDETDSAYSTFGIHEAYYNPDQSIKFVTEHPVDPWGETFEELKENMHMMAEAFHKPVVDWNHAWDEE